MKLRVRRTFKWVLAVPSSEVRMGGSNPYKLEATDTLQYLDQATDTWVDVDVVEDEKPVHPNEARRAKQMDDVAARMERALRAGRTSRMQAE